MSYILFFVYLVFFSWLLTKIRLIKNAGIGTKAILVIFLLKVIACIVNGWQMQHVNYVADMWIFHNEGVKEYHILFSHPKEYFLNFFRSNYSTYGDFYSDSSSYWNDLETNIMIKFLSVLDIFSFGNYFVNAIFYNFITLFGNVLLFKIFADIYKDRKNVLLVCCFLLPSLLYFGSSIHKEGLILLAISLIIYHIYFSLKAQTISMAAVFSILLSSVLIFFLRNFVFLAMLPAILAWIISHYNKQRSLLIFTIVYTVSAVLFFNANKINSRLNLPERVVEKQRSFLSLPTSSTNIELEELYPTFKSFVSNAPQAFGHSLIRPYITDAFKYAKYLFPFAAETLVYELLIVLFIFFYIRKKQFNIINEPMVLFGIFFSLSMCLMIGYTIPVMGAIIRYRSIYLPFILIPFLCNIEFKKNC